MARTDCVIVECAGWRHKKAGEIIKELKESLSCGGVPQPWKKVIKMGYSRGRVEVHFAEDVRGEMTRCHEEWTKVEGYNVELKLGGAHNGRNQKKREADGDAQGHEHKKQNKGEDDGLPNLFMLVRDKRKNVVYAGHKEGQAPSLASRTVPLVEYSYADQMKMKSTYARTIAKLMTKEVFEKCKKMRQSLGGADTLYPEWAFAKWQRGVPVLDIIECPKEFQQNYRNKMEFTIGYPFDWETKTFDYTNHGVIGFVRGNHQFEPIVEGGDDLVHVPDICTTIRHRLVNFINDAEKNTAGLKSVLRKDLASIKEEEQHLRGHLRTLQVRTFAADDSHPEENGGKVMLTLLVYGDAESAHGKTTLEACKKMMLALFGEGTVLDGKWNVASIYIAMSRQANDILTSKDFNTCIFGEEALQQCLMGMNFEVTPFSFFQTNIGSTKVLYSRALEWALDKYSTETETTPTANKKKVLLFDICCGTGTIGLIGHKILRDKGVDSHVIGVDCVAEAIEAAKRNTTLNGEDMESQFEWIADYVENVFNSVLDQQADKIENEYDDVICIVDPPRGGLHPSVLKSLRNTRALKRVVYISCNPESLVKDGLILSSTESMMTGAEKTMISDGMLPFYPSKAVPVDMFPHTAHTEMVVEFERVTEETLTTLGDNGMMVREDEVVAPKDTASEVVKEVAAVNPLL